MANELTITTSLAFSKSGVKDVVVSDCLKNASVSGGDYVRRTQIIGNSAEALDIGEIGTCGFMWAKNNGPTDTITLRAGSDGADVISLKASDPACLFRLATSTPYAVSNSTSNPVLEYVIIEA